MTALVISDLHLSAKRRDAYRFAAMNTFTELIRSEGPDEILVLGDLTEEKDYHSAELVNDIVDLFYVWSGLAPVYILLGNHDYTQIDTPFFHFLRRVEGIKWITKAGAHDLSIGRALFLPHTRDYKKDWAPIGRERARWVFAHNAFEGCVTEHGKRLSGIPLSALSFGGQVIAGDIHTPQELAGGRVVYVGAPYSVDFGDDYKPRVLWLDGNGTMDPIPLDGPQKRLIEITSDPDLEKALKRAKVKKGDIVKVRVLLDPEDQDNWLNIRADVKETLEQRGFNVHLVQPDTKLIKARSIKIRKAETKSDELIVQEYAKAKKADGGTLTVGLGLL